MNVDEVIKTYFATGSLNKTSRESDVCASTVRRILFLNGKYKSDIGDKINKLYKSGLSQSDIAERLSISKKCVNSYLPYTKGIYKLDEPSENALKIRNCRIKKERLIHHNNHIRNIREADNNIPFTYLIFDFS